jgi:hypothetical protein
MKKLAALLLSLLLVFSMTVSAAADLLWEPEDSYYHKQTDYPRSSLYCVYYVPEGLTCTVYRSPADPTVLAILEPGTEIYVGFSLTIDGEEWGVGAVHGSDVEGCFRLARLQKEYDHEDFRLEYSDQIRTDDSVVLHADDLEEAALLWRYPGSGQRRGSISKKLLLYEQSGQYHDGTVPFQFFYTDPDGGTWGYVSYFYGDKGWIYLDDPENPEPPLFPRECPSTVTDTSPAEEPLGAAVEADLSGNSSLYLIVGLVAAVVIATGIIIVILKRKHKENLP